MRAALTEYAEIPRFMPEVRISQLIERTERHASQMIERLKTENRRARRTDVRHSGG